MNFIFKHSGTPTFFLFVFLFALTVASHMARASSSCTIDDVRPLFCADTEDETLYDKYRLSSYKMLIPGMNGWIFRTQSDLKMDFSIEPETIQNLSRLNEELKKKGVHLILFIMPTRGMMHSSQIPPEIASRLQFDQEIAWNNYQETMANMKENGLDVVSFPRSATEEEFFYKRDHHWNAYGARKGAALLAEHINGLKISSDIPTVPFTTHENGNMAFYGVFKKVFKKLCSTEQPPENITLYRTERSDAATGADALFGETKDPEIVLAGTSNSTPEPSMANFEGFLREALQKDILNMSVSGGGVETAILDYLNSDFYAKKPAKILIWEVPSYYDLDDQKTFFREALPAVGGDCKKVVAHNVIDPIEYEQFIALEDFKDKIHGSDYFLRLNFEKPVPKGFVVDFRYYKNRERYRFPRPAQTESENRFNVSLRNDKKGDLQKVILDLPDSMLGQKLEVSLCKK